MTEFKRPEKTISQKLVAPEEEVITEWNANADDPKKKKRIKTRVRIAVWTTLIGSIIYLAVPYQIERSAWTYMENNDYQKALEILNSAPWDADLFTVIYARASCYNELKQYQKAADAYTRLINKSPAEDWGYVARGDCYLHMQRYDVAQSDFNQAIKLNPKSAPAYSSRAELYEKTGKSLLAKTDLAIATKLEEIRDRKDREDEKAEADARAKPKADADIDTDANTKDKEQESKAAGN
jgi:tetratricopeptide (TPR) repeat protein